MQFTPVLHRVRPKDHIEILRPLVPARYGPLQANGDGKQGVYLTELPAPFAEVLAGFLDLVLNQRAPIWPICPATPSGILRRDYKGRRPTGW